ALPPVNDINVRRGIHEFVEAHDQVLGHRMRPVDLLEQLQCALHFVRRHVAGQPEVYFRFDVRTARDVGDGRVARRLVWNGDQLTGGIPTPRAAQADGFHRAGGAVGQRDGVADAERLVQENRDAAEQIGQGVLRGEADGQAADGERGDGRGDVDTDVVE